MDSENKVQFENHGYAKAEPNLPKMSEYTKMCFRVSLMNREFDYGQYDFDYSKVSVSIGTDQTLTDYEWTRIEDAMVKASSRVLLQIRQERAGGGQ